MTDHPTNDETMSEQQIRDALTGLAGAPGAPDEIAGWDDVRSRIEHDRYAPRRRALIALTSVAAAAAAVVAVVVLADGDRRETVEVGPIDTPTTVDRPITTDPTTAISVPSVSVQGFPARPLALVVGDPDHSLYRLDLYDGDTGDLVQGGLAVSSFSINDVSFGPDGTVYFAEELGDTYTVRSVPWDGSAEPVSPFGLENETRSPAMSPDGRTFAYVHQGVTTDGGEIVLVDTATGDKQALQWAPDEEDYFLTNGQIRGLEWSPDGTRLLFVTSYEGSTPMVIDVDAQSLSEAEYVEDLSASPVRWLGPDEVVGLNNCCYPNHDEAQELRRVGVRGGGAIPIAGTRDTIAFDVDDAGTIAIVRADGSVALLDPDGTVTEIDLDEFAYEVGF